jgi:hypothetical protein
MEVLKMKIREEVTTLITAIKKFNENPETLDNLESYLNNHFDAWACKWANTPEGFINELKQFSEIEF